MKIQAQKQNKRLEPAIVPNLIDKHLIHLLTIDN